MPHTRAVAVTQRLFRSIQRCSVPLKQSLRSQVSRHAQGRGRAQRAEFRALAHGGGNLSAVLLAVAQSLEEGPGGQCEEDELAHAARARAPLELLDDESSHSRAAPLRLERYRSKQADLAEALEGAGADDPRSRAGDDELRMGGGEIVGGQPAALEQIADRRGIVRRRGPEGDRCLRACTQDSPPSSSRRRR